MEIVSKTHELNTLNFIQQLQKINSYTKHKFCHTKFLIEIMRNVNAFRGV